MKIQSGAASINNEVSYSFALLALSFGIILLGVLIICKVFLNRYAFVPLINTDSILEKIKQSAKLTKGFRFKIFLYYLKCALLCILVIPAPWAIKNYLVKISELYLNSKSKLELEETD